MKYAIEAVTSSRGPDFAEAYAALAAEFAPRGELERREVLERWLDDPSAVPSNVPDFHRAYHLLVARTERGQLAGVRDCHVVYDPKDAVVVVYLAHVLVLPAYRRSGLAARFRQEPIELARRGLQATGVDASAMDVLVAAEMEPADPADLATLVRLVAYGKEGFAAIDPAALPYCQPDFQQTGPWFLPSANVEQRNQGPVPIPLLAVVRWLGHEGAGAVPRRLARAFVRHLYAVFSTHVRVEHLAALEARTLEALDAFPRDEVPLLPLPRVTDDETAVAALSRAAVLPFFPAELR